MVAPIQSNFVTNTFLQEPIANVSRYFSPHADQIECRGENHCFSWITSASQYVCQCLRWIVNYFFGTLPKVASDQTWGGTTFAANRRGLEFSLIWLNGKLHQGRDPNPELTMQTMRNVIADMIQHASPNTELEISYRSHMRDGNLTQFSIQIKSTGGPFNPLLSLADPSSSTSSAALNRMITPYWRAMYGRNEDKNSIKLNAQIGENA